MKEIRDSDKIDEATFPELCKHCNNVSNNLDEMEINESTGENSNLHVNTQSPENYRQG